MLLKKLNAKVIKYYFSTLSYRLYRMLSYILYATPYAIKQCN